MEAIENLDDEESSIHALTASDNPWPGVEQRLPCKYEGGGFSSLSPHPANGERTYTLLPQGGQRRARKRCAVRKLARVFAHPASFVYGCPVAKENDEARRCSH